MKETLRRAGRTFLQAALGYIVANLTAAMATGESVNAQKTALMTLTVSAIAAGLAAVMNLPQKEGEQK